MRSSRGIFSFSSIFCLIIRTPCELSFIYKHKATHRHSPEKNHQSTRQTILASPETGAETRYATPAGSAIRPACFDAKTQKKSVNNKVSYKIDDTSIPFSLRIPTTKSNFERRVRSHGLTYRNRIQIRFFWQYHSQTEC